MSRWRHCGKLALQGRFLRQHLPQPPYLTDSQNSLLIVVSCLCCPILKTPLVVWGSKLHSKPIAIRHHGASIGKPYWNVGEVVLIVERANDVVVHGVG